MNPPFEFRRPFAMPTDFHRLGLRRGECSSLAIRNATHSAVHRLVDASARQPLELIDRQLGQLATSAYRLLDPRYRLQLYERIQLTYAVDRDELMPSFERNALLTVPDQSIEFRGSVENSVPDDERSTSSVSLESAREIVRWIRHTEEKRRRSHLNWTRQLLLSAKAWLLNRTG